MNAGEKDFEKFFAVAKAHSVDYPKCCSLAKQAFGKDLAFLSIEQLEELSESICVSWDLRFGRAGHSHPTHEI